MITLIGFATFTIIVLPMLINSEAEKFSMLRLRENQVPQNNPVISINKRSVMNWTSFRCMTVTCITL